MDRRRGFKMLNDMKLFLIEQKENNHLAAGVKEIHDVFRKQRILAWGWLVVNNLDVTEGK